MVSESGQLYTIEGFAAALIMILTAIFVFGSATVYAAGDEHITDMQLEQLANDALAMMDTPVNANSDLPVADFYAERIEEILAMDEQQWAKESANLYAEDKKYSQRFSKKGLSHYAIKYNRFMGVISDYFLHDNDPSE